MFEATIANIDSLDKEDMNRCLDDWYSRGGNIIIEGDTLRNRYEGNYRRMPKKPWATKEWVDQRDHKLYTLMKDQFSPEFWQKIWTCGYLLPHSPNQVSILSNLFAWLNRNLTKQLSSPCPPGRE